MVVLCAVSGQHAAVSGTKTVSSEFRHIMPMYKRPASISAAEPANWVAICTSTWYGTGNAGTTLETYLGTWITRVKAFPNKFPSILTGPPPRTRSSQCMQSNAAIVHDRFTVSSLVEPKLGVQTECAPWQSFLAVSKPKKRHELLHYQRK